MMMHVVRSLLVVMVVLGGPAIAGVTEAELEALKFTDVFVVLDDGKVVHGGIYEIDANTVTLVQTDGRTKRVQIDRIEGIQPDDHQWLTQETKSRLTLSHSLSAIEYQRHGLPVEASLFSDDGTVAPLSEVLGNRHAMTNYQFVGADGKRLSWAEAWSEMGRSNEYAQRLKRVASTETTASRAGAVLLIGGTFFVLPGVAAFDDGIQTVGTIAVSQGIGMAVTGILLLIRASAIGDNARARLGRRGIHYATGGR